MSKVNSITYLVTIFPQVGLGNPFKAADIARVEQSAGSVILVVILPYLYKVCR